MNELNTILTHPVGLAVGITVAVIILAAIIYYIRNLIFFLFDRIKFFRNPSVVNAARAFVAIMAVVYGSTQYEHNIINRFYSDYIPSVVQIVLLIIFLLAILISLLPTKGIFNRNKNLEL